MSMKNYRTNLIRLAPVGSCLTLTLVLFASIAPGFNQSIAPGQGFMGQKTQQVIRSSSNETALTSLIWLDAPLTSVVPEYPTVTKETFFVGSTSTENTYYRMNCIDVVDPVRGP